MAIELTPHLVDLVYDAALKSYWRHAALRKFLREMKISGRFLATWHKDDETKRQFLDRLFETLQRRDSGRHAIFRMARALAEQRSFPDLEHWEDSADKLRQAHTAVQRLRAHLQLREEEDSAEQERIAAREEAMARREASRRSAQDLERLGVRLNELSTRIGEQAAGYEFQGWFYDLVRFSEVVHRKPYVTGGRQVDGAITVDGTTYLVELPPESPEVQEGPASASRNWCCPDEREGPALFGLHLTTSAEQIGRAAEFQSR